jgi:hypothetical protein
MSRVGRAPAMPALGVGRQADAKSALSTDPQSIPEGSSMPPLSFEALEKA